MTRERLLEMKRDWDALDPATKAAEEAEAWARMRKASARMEAYIEQSLEGVPERERWRFLDVPVHELRRAKVLYLAANSRPSQHLASRRSSSRPRERRQRRAARTSGSRGDPSEPPLARELTRAEREYLRAEIDRRQRKRLAAERALDRALFRWGAAEVVA
jgi:hypothetical protein